jgi:putative DNA modification/repair radical SAM protein
MSINLEMPTEAGLKLVAPDKSHEAVKKPLAFVNNQIQALKEEKKIIKRVPLFVPAGQSTQMVVGATPENDFEIMSVADEYYKNYQLKRVYYSGYIPINNENALLPAIGTAPPLVRENRLYQTDWLMRFYGFKLDEILNPSHQHLDLDIDPKLSWALRNPHFFPVDVNTAPYEDILRIPGVGKLSAMKIVKARKFGKLYGYQLRKMGIAYSRAQHFMTYADAPFTLGAKQMHEVKAQILHNGNSKYKAINNQQLALF